ncbi:riboflavin synthase [Acetobacteraceae bacterium KSS8]|uniref:Riboflavin synthase n=1 Tax=Endosaccharibacter trunci TaxID=2812733 RepID=A0ABT1W5U1_9PROT|nr:riboflavin synthase [Acetobacteraceae bacterium KSS8]
MFSGIIERLGRIHRVTPGDGTVQFDVETGFPDLSLGESVAVNGVCLTVTKFDPQGRMSVFVSPETLRVTALGRLAEGHKVNLERAVTPSTRLSGHIVQGHVDGVGRLDGIAPSGEARVLRFVLPARLRRYCVDKGSITLDGISLTLNRIEEPDEVPGGNDFAVSVTIIPHTWDHTTLGGLGIGDPINVEIDVIAKYVEQFARIPA